MTLSPHTVRILLWRCVGAQGARTHTHTYDTMSVCQKLLSLVTRSLASIIFTTHGTHIVYVNVTRQWWCALGPIFIFLYGNHIQMVFLYVLNFTMWESHWRVSNSAISRDQHIVCVCVCEWVSVAKIGGTEAQTPYTQKNWVRWIILADINFNT